MKPISRSVTILFLFVFLLLQTAFASETKRVQVRLDASEAEQVLAILAKKQQAQPITDKDWAALFATEPYQRLKKREAAIHNGFTDDDFKKFVLSSELAGQYEALSRTLEVWKKADLRAGGIRVLQYLPAEAVIRVKVFPAIKPISNSFVFDMDTDPVIFLYLDPKVTPEEFDNTVSHEMHHIGLSSTGSLYDKKIAALAPGARKAAEWMGAFGEGLAVLAAAGGPDESPTRFVQPKIKKNWEEGMKNFNRDVKTVDTFFRDAIDQRLKDDAADQKAFEFYGNIQGPWYTVGYKMAVMVERRFGRAALIECILDPRLLLERYNQAATEANASSRDTLALWSPEVLKAVRQEEKH